MEIAELQHLQSTAELPKIIQKFNENALLLRDIYDKTKRHLHHISEILKTETDSGADPEDDLLKQIDVTEIEEVMETLKSRNPTHLSSVELDHSVTHNPCIAIIGQTKAGKSTFINTLLEQYVVPQDIQKCTARITHLTYSAKNYVQLRDPHTGIVPGSYKELEHSYLPTDLPALNDSERDDEQKSKIIVEGGINSPFLENGIDVLDSPGLNENRTLDDLVKNMVTSVMPFIIYLIEGRRTVTEADITDIRHIKDTCPNLEIIYFVTKLDTDRRARGKKEINEKEEVRRRLKLVFDKLKRNGFLPDDADMDTCRFFHGASLWKVKDARDRKTTDDLHVKGFETMKTCLANLVAEHLTNTIQRAAQTFVRFNECILEKIIKRASLIYFDAKKKLNDIKDIAEEEKKIFESVMDFLQRKETHLKQKLVQKLNESHDRLMQPLNEHKYPPHFEIPPDGVMTDERLIGDCQKNISSAICVALETEVKHFIDSEVLQVYMGAEAFLSKHIEDMSKTSVSKTSFRDMLQNILYNIYDLNYTGGPQLNKSGFWNNVLSHLKSFKTSLLELLGLRGATPSTNVYDHEWKKKQAELFLQKLNKEDFATKVCKTLQTDMEKKHSTFLFTLETEAKHVNSDVKLSEENRKKLVEMSPDFAKLFMEALSIRGTYDFEGMRMECKIGEGAQGKVYQVRHRGKPYAMKVANVQKENMGDVAMEIYFSSTFHHQRLLPLYGVWVQRTDEPETFKVSMIMPKMKTDASKLLRSSRPPLGKRLTLALQVCEAIVYLHEENIMHRDLKLANILIDENDDAVVADYGFVKNVSLNMGSFVGTPVHIAPEVVRGDRVYDLSVDVYSFGVLIWYFAEGTGRHPKYTKDCSSVAAVLMAATDNGARPEHNSNFNEPLWKLMNECWSLEPRQRPSIQQVCERLDTIIRELD